MLSVLSPPKPLSLVAITPQAVCIRREYCCLSYSLTLCAYNACSANQTDRYRTQSLAA
jgi:hypothetical protein